MSNFISNSDPQPDKEALVLYTTEVTLPPLGDDPEIATALGVLPGEPALTGRARIQQSKHNPPGVPP